MKQIIIVIVSITIVCVGAFISQNYINTTSNELVGKIEELKPEIEKAKSKEENNSVNMSEAIYEQWKDFEKTWSVIVVHSELDLIELSLIGMKTYIEQEVYEEANEELERAIFLLQHIKEKEKFTLENIL